MTEKDYLNNDGSGVESRGKSAGTLVLAALLVLIVLVVFIFINSGISARIAGPAEGTAINTAAAGAGSCCSFGSPEADSTESLAQAALVYYREGGGNTDGVQAVVDDYGCHQEISLIREGELIKRYSYLGSGLIDITP